MAKRLRSTMEAAATASPVDTPFSCQFAEYGSLACRLVPYSGRLVVILEARVKNLTPQWTMALVDQVFAKKELGRGGSGRRIFWPTEGLAVTLAERAFRRLATRLGDPQSQQAVSGLQCRQLLLD